MKWSDQRGKYEAHGRGSHVAYVRLHLSNPKNQHVVYSTFVGLKNKMIGQSLIVLEGLSSFEG